MMKRGNPMLNITKKIDNKKMVIALAGKLDTTTAPELEQIVKTSLDGVTELTIDMKELSYISSAGLRVLLMAVKKLGKVTVSNASEAVKEIFETTGFDQMMSVE